MRKYFSTTPTMPHLRAHWHVSSPMRDFAEMLSLGIHEPDGELIRFVELTRDQAVDLAKRILARAGEPRDTMEGDL